MEHDNIAFLKELNKNGVNINKPITDLINSKFPIDSNPTQRYLAIKAYLGKLRSDGYIDYEIKQVENSNEVKEVTALLKIGGYKFLNELDRDKSINRLSKVQTWILIGSLVISGFSVYISKLSYDTAALSYRAMKDQLGAKRADTTYLKTVLPILVTPISLPHKSKTSRHP